MNEASFLIPLFLIAEAGVTPAEVMLAAYKGRWKGSVDPIFTECAY
jgi:glutamate--cysteine ligase